MPPPSAVICEICGGKYSKHSLAIHQKACVKKREESTDFCPVCDQLVSNDEYGKHVEECKRVNAPLLKEKKAKAAAEQKAVNNAKKGSNTNGTAPINGLQGNTVGSAAAINATATAIAETQGEKPGSSQQQKRSKIPESVLRRLEAAKAGGPNKKPLSVEEQLATRLGESCHACGTKIACVLCVDCHTVYCNDCCEMIHEVNKALSNHKPVMKEEFLAKQVAAEEEGTVDARVNCHICQRKFDPTRIAKHQLVCTKQNNKAPRKAFKSTIEDRLKGTEFEKFNRQTLAMVTAAAKAAAAAALANMKKPGSANSTTTSTATNANPTNFPPPPPHKAGAVSKLGAVNVGLIPTPSATTTVASPSTEDSRWRKEHEQLMAIASANKGTTGSTPLKGSSNENKESNIGTSNAGSVRTITASSPNSVHSNGTTITGVSSVTLGESISTNVTPSKLFTDNGGNNENIPPVLDTSITDAPVVTKEKPPQIGEKVFLLDKNVTGILQFKGPVWGLKKGVWYGIEFHDGAHGRNNGSYNGTTYFYCKDNHGIFVRPDRVSKVQDSTPSSSSTSNNNSSNNTDSIKNTTATPSAGTSTVKKETTTSTVTASKPALLTRINATKPVSQSSTTTTIPSTEDTTTVPSTKPTARTPPKQSAPAPASITPPKDSKGSKIPSPSNKNSSLTTTTTTTTSSSSNVLTATSTNNNNTSSSNSGIKAPSTSKTGSIPKPLTTSGTSSRPNSSASTSKPVTGSSSTNNGNNNTSSKSNTLASKLKTIPSITSTAAVTTATAGSTIPRTDPVPSTKGNTENTHTEDSTTGGETDTNGVAFTVGDNKGFSKSLVERLRKKVEVQRPSTRLVDEVKAKQNAALTNPPPVTTTSSNTPVKSSSSVSNNTENTNGSQLSQEELRRRDIARNVDYLRVLAGEKSKLAADPGAGKEYIPFGGGGAKLGGDRTNLPMDTGNGMKKKIVTAQGNVTYAKGVTDSANEREKRAAAALARLNSMTKPVTSTDDTE